MKTSLTTIVLDAIEFELDDSEYCNGLDNSVTMVFKNSLDTNRFKPMKQSLPQSNL